MSELNDWNRRVIEEFRANDGAVEQFKGMTILLLHHTGAKSGKAYTNPLAYAQEGDRYYVFASKAGADHHPDWYHNLVAHPDVKLELKPNELTDAKATVLEGEERDRVYNGQAERYPVFGQYQQKAKRTIPVVAFDPA
jgi:deazaflavin-dependent oxidoreductase (nitroreductase family)